MFSFRSLFALKIVFIFVFCLLFPSDTSVSAQSELQSLIDQASPGDEVVLPEGVYEEELVITKPLKIIGDGVTLKNSQSEVAIHIKSDQVYLTGLTVIHENDGPNSTAILIEGNDNIIKHLIIRSIGIGVILNEAHRNYLEQLQIERDKPVNLADTSMGSRQGNGIDLFGSHDNVLHNNTMINLLDGVYLESSRGNIVEFNNVTNSRYGFHLMFTENTTLSNNSASQNITGAMVMGTSGTTITFNNLSKQHYHVHSQGLLLYDVHDATIQGNIVSENLIGIYIERSSNNIVFENKVLANFVGLQLNKVENHDIYHNDFYTNVVQARVTDSPTNRVSENYWDTHAGLDFTGDGKSELAFSADPIFLSLVEKKPPYQLLSQSPGLLFLDLLLDKNEAGILRDSSPLMEPYQQQLTFIQEKYTYDIFVYLFLIGLSITIILGGIRR
ncbi:NosD domain-containing protein [Bacillaceae bacterium IKA-2]|nr:NosD domain-containing protein [Bacillaceae bacterium IKA-2]